MFLTLPKNISLLIKVEKICILLVMSVVFNHVPLRLERLLVSVPAITIAADFTDYSFTLSHENEGFQYVDFHYGLVFFSCNPHSEKKKQKLPNI